MSDPAAKEPSILVVGDAFCDVNAGPLPNLPHWGRNTISPEAIVAHPGGAALNVASGLKRLLGDTSKVALFSGIGRDAFGDMLRRHCASLQVELHEATPSDPTLPTGVCMVLSGRDDRAFCSHFGIADKFDAAQLIADDGAALRALAPRHIHCAGFYSCGALRKTLPALLASAKALGATISLDTNNDASGLWGEVDGLWATLLPMLDLFMPNELEACAIAGVASSSAGESAEGAEPQPPPLDEALAKLTSQVGGVVVVTRGAAGVVIAGRGVSTPIRVPSPVVEPLDPVGAGDAFKAGFLSRYVDGVPLDECARCGVLAGALCVTKRGACLDPPTRAQLAAFARERGCDPAAVGES